MTVSLSSHMARVGSLALALSAASLNTALSAEIEHVVVLVMENR